MERDVTWIRKLRVAVAVVAVATLVAAVPVALGLRGAAGGQAAAVLDQLRLPSWTSAEPVDTVRGNRWCVGTCRWRERTWDSERGVEETAQAYRDALTEQGWRPAPDCLEVDGVGSYECYRRDEFALDLLVLPGECAEDEAECETATATATIVIRPRTGDDAAG
ncbi:MAG: hypothetical protein ACRDXX_17530 [Stackebrandtia sp.]